MVYFPPSNHVPLLDVIHHSAKKLKAPYKSSPSIVKISAVVGGILGTAIGGTATFFLTANPLLAVGGGGLGGAIGATVGVVLGTAIAKIAQKISSVFKKNVLLKTQQDNFQTIKIEKTQEFEERDILKFSSYLSGDLVLEREISKFQPGFLEHSGLKLETLPLENEMINFKELDDYQLTQLFTHMIVDWVIQNDDVSYGHFGIDDGQNIVAIHKLKAFSSSQYNNKFDLKFWNDNSIYNQMIEFLKDDPEKIRGIWTNLELTWNSIEALTQEQFNQFFPDMDDNLRNQNFQNFNERAKNIKTEMANFLWKLKPRQP
jgi:hypothetical protein